MSTVVNCPSCSRKLRVPDEMAGKKVKCPGCGTTFLAQANGAVETPPDPDPEPPPRKSASSAVSERPSQAGKQRVDEEPADEDDRPRRRREEEDDEYEERPRRRGRDTEEDEEYSRPSRRSERRRGGGEPHRGALVLTLGIISIAMFALGLVASCVIGGFALIFFLAGLGLGIPPWIMGSKDLGRMAAGSMDREGKGNTTAGYVMGIVGTILNGLTTFCCVLGIILALAGIAGMATWMEEMEQKQKKQQRNFEQPAAPLRLQDYLPDGRR